MSLPIRVLWFKLTAEINVGQICLGSSFRPGRFHPALAGSALAFGVLIRGEMQSYSLVDTCFPKRQTHLRQFAMLPCMKWKFFLNT